MRALYILWKLVDNTRLTDVYNMGLKDGDLERALEDIRDVVERYSAIRFAFSRCLDVLDEIESYPGLTAYQKDIFGAGLQEFENSLPHLKHIEAEE